MFLPENVTGPGANKAEVERKNAYKRIEEWSLQLIPEPLRKDVTVSIQEIQCGDPKCSPIDTAIAVVFDSGGQGMFGVPSEAKDVAEEELRHFFPTSEVLEKWHKGEQADWPPMVDEDLEAEDFPKLRFEVGTKVLCRVGPQDWAPGTISQLWYREPQWPAGSFAPYKIKLDSGSDIFAPGDLDQVIRRNPNA